MKIQLTQKAKNSSTPIFFLNGKEKAENHDFFKLFSKEDGDYIRCFWDKKSDDEFLRSLLLPSGRKALVILEKENKKNSLRKTIISMRRLISLARKEKIKELAVSLEYFTVAGSKKEEIAELMATQFELANFEFNQYKTVPKGGWNFVENVFVVAKENVPLKKALANGKIIGEEINKARALSNPPGGDMTPKLLAEEARKACKGTKISVKILGKKEMKKLGMGAVLGVAQGSVEEPKFIILEYKGGGKEKPASPGASQGGPIVLVGKGVTFDTGGLNLKPSNSILEMHMDMSGGAAVIHAVVLAARLKLKKNVVGLIPAVENMPSGSSYR